MGIPIIAGREFDAQGYGHLSKVAVISEALARKAFPGMNRVAAIFAHWHPREGKQGDLIEVVGVCADTAATGP